MAYTQFVKDLANAINAGNRSKVASLLNDATTSTWTAAGIDISETLILLGRSTFTSQDIASFSTTIVSKGTVSSNILADSIYKFIIDGNFTGAKNILNAAAGNELTASASQYGDLLIQGVMISHSLTRAQKAELATLLITKTTVSSDDIADTIYRFALDGNLTGAKNVLNAAAANELTASASQYGDVLTKGIMTSSSLTAAQKAELATLLVTKATVNSDDIVDAVGWLAGSGNFTGAKNVLNAAAANELTASGSRYGDMLYHNIVNSSALTAGQKGELATLLITKTTVGSAYVAEALHAFITDNNCNAAKSILTAATGTELNGNSVMYGNLLMDTVRAQFTDTQRAELTKLLLTKTNVNAEYVAEAALALASKQSYAAIDAIMEYGSTNEKGQLTQVVHQLLDERGYHGGSDNVAGTSGADTLYGYGGDDNLWGYDGNDILFGGSGNDRLNGHKGADRLTGGTGQDTFVISYKDAVDTITDFKTAEHDILALHNTLFSASKTSVENALEDFVFARTSGSSTIISIDADGRGSGGAVDVAILQNLRNVDIRDWHSKGLLDIE